MIEKKIYIAADGTEFSEDEYGSAEEAMAECEEYERIKATYYLHDDRQDKWFNLSAKTTELITIKKVRKKSKTSSNPLDK